MDRWPLATGIYFPLITYIISFIAFCTPTVIPPTFSCLFCIQGAICSALSFVAPLSQHCIRPANKQTTHHYSALQPPWVLLLGSEGRFDQTSAAAALKYTKYPVAVLPPGSRDFITTNVFAEPNIQRRLACIS